MNDQSNGIDELNIDVMEQNHVGNKSILIVIADNFDEVVIDSFRWRCWSRAKIYFNWTIQKVEKVFWIEHVWLELTNEESIEIKSKDINPVCY